MLQDKKLFLFDIDGTLAVEDRLFDGSRGLLEHIEKMGGTFYFITNNSTKSSTDYVKKFARWGIPAREEQFITAGAMTVRFLKRNYLKEKIYVLGTRSFLKELWSHGLQVVERPEEGIACAVVAYDSELTYEKLTWASEVLSNRNVPFYATNPDLCCPASFGFVPDCGAICGMLTCATGRKPLYLGKPNGEMVRLCMERSGISRKETLVVGDRLYTDIACGINGGVETCVVFTGEAKREELIKTEYKPDYSFDTVLDILKELKKQR